MPFAARVSAASRASITKSPFAISVISFPSRIFTPLPIDKELILEEAKKTKHVVVAEEHQIWGGMGSAIATFLGEAFPCKMGFVAIQDTFAESGLASELLEKYGLTAPHIVTAAEKVLA